ncbi:MAG: hypothetical protein LBK08_07575 [Treponema sp.]|jgi:hypothetical protein|nr:hypothetical protein [Treponema sp.]
MKSGYFIFLFFAFVVDVSFGLDINVNMGTILKGYFEGPDAKCTIYFNMEFPDNLYVNNSNESIKRLKVICDDWEDYAEYYENEEEPDIMTKYPFFVAGKLVLENQDETGSGMALKIIDMILEYDDYSERGLDFQNMRNCVFDEFLVEGELFYVTRPFGGFYMKIYGKLVAIHVNDYLLNNFKEIFERDISANIKGDFIVRRIGSGHGTFYDEDDDWTFTLGYGLYVIVNYRD